MKFLDQAISPLADTFGASIDEVKLLLTFAVSYPSAGILKRLPDSKPHVKNAFVILVSSFYLVGLFSLWTGVRTVLIASVGAYAIAASIHSPYMPWIAFVYLMGHMAINHIWRQIVDDPSVVDITGVQMVLVTKLTSFCWNVHDGRQPQKDLSETQKYAAIKEMPGLLDYAAYVLFFPSLFVGPACEYMDYKRWIDTTLFDIPPGTDPSKAPPTHKQRRIPRSGTPAMKKAVSGVIWLLLYIIFRGKFDPSLLLKDEFESLPFLRRVFLLHMVGFVARWIYYSVWSLSEGACILTGLGYNGFDPHTGQAHWNHLENVNPVGLETAQNPYLYVGSWNQNTNHWLRSYVYLRVTPKGKKPGFRATLATFVTSAFWHGLYPGYYLTFVLGSVIQVTAKNFRRHVRPFFLLPTDESKGTTYKPLYDALSWLVTQLTLSFAVIPFIILRFDVTLQVWSHVYYYGLVNVVIGQVLFLSPAKTWLMHALKRRNGTKQTSPKPKNGKIDSDVKDESGNNEQDALNNRNQQGSLGERILETGITGSPVSERESPVLGMPADMSRDFDDAVKELLQDADVRKLKENLPGAQDSGEKESRKTL